MANYTRVHQIPTQSGELEVRHSTSGSTIVGLWITNEYGRYQGCILTPDGLDELRRVLLEVGA